MKRTTIILIFSLLGLGFYSCQPQPQDEGTAEITAGELHDHIAFLASDELKGRKPGTPGDKEAASYIAGEFETAGLKSLNNNYFQKFEVITGISTGENNRLTIGDTEATLNEDYIPLSFSENGEVSSEVIFVGYGFDIQEDSLQWNDYDGIDTEGKWLLVLRGDPELNESESPFVPYSNNLSKLVTARDHKAAGVLFVSGTAMDENDELTELRLGRGETSAGLPAIHITREMANLILPENQPVEKLEQQLNEQRTAASFACETTVNANVDLVKSRETTQNVIGVLEGNDPELKNRYIVIGAHYDHLGMGGPNSGSRVPDTTAVHNGADDNASGVSTVIELAEKLAANSEHLKRSIVFMAFGAEEMGLLGSKYFVENPLIELDNIEAMFNFDMLGRLDSSTHRLSIGGTGTAAEMEDILNSLRDSTQLEVAFSKEGYGPSDHASFYTQNIPVLFFTTGGHDDYHTPTDDVEFIDADAQKQVSDFIYLVAEELASRTEPLTFQEAGPKYKQSQRRGLKVTLGIIPAFGESDNTGLGVDGVREGGPAAGGGMQKGDIIVGINGKEVTNIYDYMARLRTLEAGQQITVDVLRDEAKITLIVQL